MRIAGHGYLHKGMAALFLLMAMLCCVRPSPGVASELSFGSSLCHAVTPLSVEDTAVPTGFACQGLPDGYQHGSLWLRADIADFSTPLNDPVMMVHVSRFDRLAVAFLYEDGTVVWQQVRSGDFDDHWRAGGQIAFPAPQNGVPPVAVILRFDRLASAQVLRMRLLDAGESIEQSTALAATVGAALMLLLIGALYNASLAVAVRRLFPLCQALWAGCMALWGAMWSQLPLFFLPGLAGALTSQICTALACIAVAMVTLSAVTVIEPKDLPRKLRIATIMIGIAIGILGVGLAMMRSGPLFLLAQIISFLMVADLIAVTSCLILGWRRGSSQARAFAGSWFFPMLALWVAQFLSVSQIFWGGGSQILVLIAAAWQTLWLSVVATGRFAIMRIERDRARDAEAQAHELARRDPLTGLRNRRGLLEAVAPILEQTHTKKVPVALLILDVDLFKSVNDGYGHEAGDAVLCAIARRLEQWESEKCVSARFGGEEFALMVGGLNRFALSRFAEEVRQGIAACDHSAVVGARQITVSIGVAATERETDFRDLYRLADEALYAAKMQGRNQVEIRSDEQDMDIPAQPSARLTMPHDGDQPAFR